MPKRAGDVAANATVPGPRVIVALDFPTADAALAFVGTVQPEQCRLKVGKELFTAAGPDFVRRLVDQGFQVFLDLKFHDIPNTVARATAAAAGLGVWMLNVHAMGGQRMLAAAREALEACAAPVRPRLIGVTVLTSMAQADLAELGIVEQPAALVQRLARLALDSGLDGLVCSAQEAAALRTAIGPEPLLVTPGIRPAGAQADDQRRIMRPAEAIRAGSSYLVIGRPVTGANDPAEVLAAINQEIQALTTAPDSL